MDTLSACIGFGPLAIYLVLLGVINLSRRPLVLSGTRETLSLGLALAGLMVVGPMQLFMPQEAALRFGQSIWLLLLGFYLLCLTLTLLLSKPRIIVYNISPEQLRPALDAAAQRIDHEANWAGNALSLPLARVNLHVESFSPLGNVSLIANDADQSFGNWRRLERCLRDSLQNTETSAQPYGIWMFLIGCMILAGLTFWIVDDPQTIAQSLKRMLHP